MSEQPAFLPDPETGVRPNLLPWQQEIVDRMSKRNHAIIMQIPRCMGKPLQREYTRTYPALVTSKRDRTHRLWPWLLLAVPVVVAVVLRGCV